jgi:uncharacterized protein
MAADSMNADGTPADTRSPGGLRLLAIAYLTLFVLLILAGIAIAVFGNSGGEPVVRIRIADSGPRPVKAHPAAPAAAQPVSPAAAAIVQPVFAGTALVADPALIETTDDGPLPRIAADGRTPLQAYAAPVSDATKPRIAIIISGLGISAKATAAALAKLPPQVTLAFAPYAADVQNWVTQARQKGHEVLLEVPMEPFDFPDSDPGPHTLRSGVGEDANTERLVWALTRFTGYTGVTNLLGARLLSDSDSLEPVLTYLARRGLMFYDNGAATHSAAPDVASRVGVSFAQATLTIDSIQTAMEIDHELSELETQARANGSASGSGFLYPVTIDRVSQWAQGLAGRGFVLVPASAIVASKK